MKAARCGLAEAPAQSAQEGERASHVGGGVTQVLPSVPQTVPTGQHVVPQVFWAPAQQKKAEQAETWSVKHAAIRCWTA